MISSTEMVACTNSPLLPIGKTFRTPVIWIAISLRSGRAPPSPWFISLRERRGPREEGRQGRGIRNKTGMEREGERRNVYNDPTS